MFNSSNSVDWNSEITVLLFFCGDRVSQPFPGCIWTAKVTTSKAAAHLSVFLNLLLMRLHPAPRALRRAMPKDWKRWKYGFNHGSRFHRVLPLMTQVIRATLFKSAGDGPGWKGSAKKGNVRDAMHTLLPLHTKSSVTQQSFMLYSLHHHWFIVCKHSSV